MPIETERLAGDEPAALPDVPPPLTRRDRVVLARLAWAGHGIASGAPVTGPAEVQSLVARYGERTGGDWGALLAGLRERIEADNPPLVTGWESWIRMVAATVRAACGANAFPALRTAFAEEWPSDDLTPAEAVAVRYLTTGPQLVPALLIALSGTMAWEELAEIHDHLVQEWWVRARLLLGASSGHPWVDAARLRDVAGGAEVRIAARPARTPGLAWWRSAEQAARDTGTVVELPPPGTWRDRVHAARIRWVAADAPSGRVAEPERVAAELVRQQRVDWPKYRVTLLIGLREVLDRGVPQAGLAPLAEALAVELAREAGREGWEQIRRAFGEELSSCALTAGELQLAHRLTEPGAPALARAMAGLSPDTPITASPRRP